MPGWAKHSKDDDGKRRPLSANPPGPGAVIITDMPGPRPEYERPRVKGVVGPTIDGDEDYRPGGGSWSSDLRNPYG